MQVIKCIMCKYEVHSSSYAFTDDSKRNSRARHSPSVGCKSRDARRTNSCVFWVRPLRFRRAYSCRRAMLSVTRRRWPRVAGKVDGTLIGTCHAPDTSDFSFLFVGKFASRRLMRIGRIDRSLSFSKKQNTHLRWYKKGKENLAPLVKPNCFCETCQSAVIPFLCVFVFYLISWFLR